MLFTEVAFTSYPAPDIAASRAFYEGLLGLVPTMAHEGEGDSFWVEYELGAHTFGIGKAPGWKASADGPVCGLEAVDFDATIALLKTADVPFRMGPMETPVCHMAIVADPAGNSLIIHKRKPGHA